MAFDAGMLRLVVNEIKKLGECKVEKVYQPSNDEIVLMLHSIKKNVKLLINAGSNCPRINITEIQTENPQKAPMLCMLLRKHISGGKMLDAKCLGYERVCSLEFEAYDEMGFKVRKFLICETMGKYSNVILTDANSKILTVMKPIDFSTSDKRQLLAGMKYELPPKQDKLDTLEITKEQFINKFENSSQEMKCEKFITSSFLGIAPSTARQIAYKVSKSHDSRLFEVKKQTLCDTFFDFTEKMRNMELKPYLIVDEQSNPFEFSYFPLEYLGNKYRSIEYESFSKLIDAYYSKKGQNERIKQKSIRKRRVRSAKDMQCFERIMISL